MFKHEKHFMEPVEVEKADTMYAVLLQEQLGGANVELKAAKMHIKLSEPPGTNQFDEIEVKHPSHIEKGVCIFLQVVV